MLAEIKYFYKVKGVRSPSAFRGVVSLTGWVMVPACKSQHSVWLLVSFLNKIPCRLECPYQSQIFKKVQLFGWEVLLNINDTHTHGNLRMLFGHFSEMLGQEYPYSNQPKKCWLCFIWSRDRKSAHYALMWLERSQLEPTLIIRASVFLSRLMTTLTQSYKGQFVT